MSFIAHQHLTGGEDKRTSAAYRVRDVDGRHLKKGDTVATLNENLNAKVCDVRMEGETGFVRLRVAHQPYSRGIWHAADHVQLITSAPIDR